MHYRIQKLTIRSENAAKTPSQVSQGLSNWLLHNVCSGAALDYGCGRLRYTPYLARGCEALGLVDSTIQLDRKTWVGDRATTIREEACKKWPRCRIYSLDEFWDGIKERYEFVLCANVLSVIPSRRIRSRSLGAILNCLTPNGKVLVVNQHTNSYFTKVSESPNSFKYFDGWLLKSSKGPAYFGVLAKEKVSRLLRAHGFRIQDTWIEGQSNYVLAGK